VGLARDAARREKLVHVALPEYQGQSRWLVGLATSVLLLTATAVSAAELRVVDLDGRRIDPFAAGPSIRANAFVFTATDCPISNRYAPEIRRLYDAFSRRGIRFWLVYANPRENATAVREHARKFSFALSVVRDPQHDLVNALGVTVTPEVAIVGPRGDTLYRGRIDDRYTDIGVDRPVATRHEFEEALSAVAEGRPVPTATTRAVGCVLADFKPVTFNKDIAPLIYDRCATCHRPTGPAPFSLLTYADVRQRATLVAAVTNRRYMPPWKADAQQGEFVGQKRLSDGEIALIREWVDNGSVEGDPADRPTPPVFPEGWQLGKPDLIVTIDKPFLLDSRNSDEFRIFVIPLPVSTTKYVTGLEFQPGNPRVVHHANIRLDRTRGSRELDDRDPLPGYDGLMARSAVYPEGHFLGWTPGQVAPLAPASMAWRLDPGTDLVVQLHMQPNGAAEPVQPVIGLFFGNEIPTRPPTILRLGSQGIDIPAGDSRYEIRDSYVLPVDVELQAVQPHAHYRLRDVEGSATLPDGTVRSLIHIGDWDFRWQHVYRYSAPIFLPKGTRLSMHYTYDNSAENPRNPTTPPERVFWGQRSFDEMGDLWFQFVPRGDADRARLNSEILQKMTAEDVIGYETMLRSDPKDTELHDDVALLYLSLGRAREAVAHFRVTASLRPTATAHYNLATALSVAGSLDEAVKQYEAALQLKPDYANAHNNLGTVLATLGRLPDAIAHFREAARLDPASVPAHRNLAWYIATMSGGSTATAEAVAAGERAATLTGRRDPQVLDAVAAAYAAAGRFDEAIAAAERAAALAGDDLAPAVRERLARYRRHEPYRVP
jgi:hypothetical protein